MSLSVGGNRSTQSKPTQTRGERAQKGPKPRFKPTTFLL
uniref:Uncharacterized protein n=1 Tax=Anguilla anguilla TaxID=7936 RepID=A0A0E9UQ31_ANGAN